MSLSRQTARRPARPSGLEPLESRCLLSGIDPTAPSPTGLAADGADALLDLSPAAVVDKQGLYYVDSYASTGSTSSQTVTLRNTGASSITLSSITLTGPDTGAFSFTSKPSTPRTIAAGASVSMSLKFKSASKRIYDAKLVLATSDPGAPTIEVALRGLGTSGSGGSNEPSLQRIFDLYQLPITVGDSDPETTELNNPPLTPNDELLMPRLLKAGAGPVTIQPLAVFALSKTDYPSVRFGTYKPGNPRDRAELLTVSSSQSVTPSTKGSLSFDPGSAAFSLYTMFPPANTTRVVYAEDSLNTWDPNVANRHKLRFYALRNKDGSVVPNAYVFTFEDAQYTTIDNQDFIGIIRNVQAAPAGPELGIENLDAVPYTDRLVFCRIDILNPDHPNVFKDQAKLRLRNTGVSDLLVNGFTISSNWELVSPPTTPFAVAPNAFIDLTIRFKATSGTVHNGTLTILTNDADEPSTVIQLAGWRQNQSENPEPSLQQVLQFYSYGTTIARLGEKLPNGGLVERIGDEILSPYWKRVDPSAPIRVRQLAAYHTQGHSATLRRFTMGNTTTTYSLFTHHAADGQTLLPRTTAGGPAYAEFSTSSTFGFRIDGFDPATPNEIGKEWSDPTLNTQEQSGGGYGHHVRFFQLRDRFGAVVPSSVLMAIDYNGINYDHQDNVYLIENVKPNSPPAAPTGLAALPTAGGVLLDWRDSREPNVGGYNVYRSDAVDGVFVKLNATPVTASEYMDSAASSSADSFYRVTAVNLHGGESATSATVSGRTLPGAAVVWREDFPHADGTSSDSDWSTDTAGVPDGSYIFAVRSNEFAINDVDALLSWNSGTFNIAGFGSINVSLDLRSSKTHETSDYIRVYYKIDGGPEQLLYKADGIINSGKWVRAAVGGLSGNTIQLIVRSFNNSGDEFFFFDNLAISGANGTPDLEAPATPTGLVATPGNASVALNWDDNAEPDLAGYDIYRALVSGGPYTKLNVSPVAASQYTDATAVNGVTYFYQVGAVDLSTNPSPLTAWVSAMPQAPATIVVWNEPFPQANGTNSDPNWSVNTSAAADPTFIFSVLNGEFASSDTNGELVWTSGVFDISALSAVSISMGVRGAGTLDSTQDYLRLYYRINGGPEQSFYSAMGKINGGNPYTAMVSGLVGSTVQIVVRSFNTAADEFHYWDNVSIIGV